MIKNISAIGLKSVEKNKRILSAIVKNAARTPDKSFSFHRKDGKSSVENYGYLGESYGIIIYGIADENGDIRTRRWNSFAHSDNSFNVVNVSFEKMHNGDVFAYCEDEETGTELEFRVNNLIDYSHFRAKAEIPVMNEAAVNIAALGRIGNIIFPVEKNKDTIKIRDEETSKIRELMRLFRNGDESAEKKLIDHSMEIASAVRERLKTEDVLSVFEGYCLPYGEVDGTYALLGDIAEVGYLENKLTEETIYNISINVTGVKFNLYINKNDVVGMPIKGMRFMGICDMQGNIEFV